MSTKTKATKSLEIRLSEMRTIYQQMYDLGLSKELEGVAEFFKIANTFVKEGIGASGSLPLAGMKRRLVYRLSMLPHVTSNVTLQYDKNI